MLRLSFESLRAGRQPTFFTLFLGAMLMTWPAPTQTAFANHKQGKEPKPHLAQSAFTYQGQLKDGGVPAEGSYDFQFTVYTAQTGGDELGSVVFEDMVLTKGLFKVELDFGPIGFDSHENWLEIAVRPGGRMDLYTVLSPRQRLTPVPYAIFAQAESWSLIGVPIGFTSGREKGMITTDRIADDAVTGAKIASASLTKYLCDWLGSDKPGAMKSPLFVRQLIAEERETLQAGLRSKDAVVLRRCQIRLASADKQKPSAIAQNLKCARQTVRDVIPDFEQRGLACLERGSNVPVSGEPVLNAEKREL
jgi:hypothetical protein